MPDALASFVRNSSKLSAVSRRTMLRKSRIGLSVVAAMPIVATLINPAMLRRCNAHVNTARYVWRSINRRVREIVEWSGGASFNRTPRKSRNANESAARHAMPRSESMPSK